MCLNKLVKKRDKGTTTNRFICYGSILSLVKILIPFVLNSLSYITIPQNKGK